MPENYKFKTDVTLELPIFREFEKLSSRVLPQFLISRFFIIGILLLYLLFLDDPFYAYAIIFLSLIEGVILLVHYSRSRKGSVGYKRMLLTNMGQPRREITYYCEDGIYCYNHENVFHSSYSYDQVRRVVQSKTMLLLMLPHQMAIIVPKAALEESTPEEFSAFLASRCPNWKSKKVTGNTFGTITEYLTIAMIVLSLLLGICNLPSIRLFDRLSGKLTNDMTYQQMADELLPLEISISQQAIDELEAYDAEYVNEFGSEYYADNYYTSKIFDLLYWEGAGFYDEETLAWTPSQSGVYYFDTEVWNVESIYTDFFIGLSAMHSELLFTDVHEDYSRADIDNGTGHVVISFVYDGMQYALTEEYCYDWFDTTVINELGNILAADGSDNELYVYYDGQGCLLYYGTPENAAQLARLTGLNFETADLIS